LHWLKKREEGRRTRPRQGFRRRTRLWRTRRRGRRGVKSARFSGAKDKDRKIVDRKNIEKVLKLLEGVPREKRTARFVCCLCLASPEKVLIETEGKLEGFIAAEELGTNGFGYDPIFFVPKLNKTVARLSSEEKNAISHRGNAIRKLKPLLEKL
jgi:XTP/dITP diphosphohydrolase